MVREGVGKYLAMDANAAESSGPIDFGAATVKKLKPSAKSDFGSMF